MSLTPIIKLGVGFCLICIHTDFGWKAKIAGFKLRVSSKGMRIIDKLGIDQVVSDIRSRGEKV